MANQDIQHCRQQNGAATLMMTLVLMVLSTMIIIFAANYGKLQSKAIANIQRNGQAYDAAQAGLEFGINYLQKNSTAILANPVSGHIVTYSNSDVTNVSLPNGSKFSITYTNPTANDYDLILVSSTGSSDDSSSTRTVSQLVKFGSVLLNSPTKPLILKGAVNMGDDSEIINTENDYTIDSGSTINLDKKAVTIIASGVSSKKKKLKSDVTENDAALSGITSSDLFIDYFGLTSSLVKSSMLNQFTNSTSTDYSSQLNGLEGTSIWIDQTGGTATIKGTTTIGSSNNPVVLIINGNPSFQDSTTIYGYVYIDNTSAVQLSGNVLIVGGLVATGAINLIDSAHIMYSSFVLDNLRNQSNLRYFAKVPGSWKDF